MSKKTETPKNDETPSDKPIRDIVTGPDFVYIQNSDQRPLTWSSKIPDIKK